MGANGAKLACTLGRSTQEVMNVDKNNEIDPLDHKFAPTMFKRMEWSAMKAFCQKYKIKQKHLMIVFKRYLTHEEVHIRQFKVRTSDVRDLYTRETLLQQEIAEIFIPSIFMKEFAGLDPIESTDELTFARFVVMSYILGREQFPDLIYDFFSIIRKKMDIPLTVVITSGAFQQMVTLLIEDHKPSGTTLLFKRTLNNMKEGMDFRLKSIMRLSVKYPHLFWALQKFRKCYQRFVFGDRFWESRKHLKLRRIDLSDIPPSYMEWFETEEKAIKFTARHVITDVLINPSAVEWFFSDQYHPPPDRISATQVTALKNVLGYKITTKLLLESQIVVDFDPIFVAPFLPHATESSVNASQKHLKNTDTTNEDVSDEDSEDGESEYIQELRDATHDREFLYNVKTGRSRWAKIVVGEDGNRILFEFE